MSLHACHAVCSKQVEPIFFVFPDLRLVKRNAEKAVEVVCVLGNSVETTINVKVTDPSAQTSTFSSILKKKYQINHSFYIIIDI